MAVSAEERRYLLSQTSLLAERDLNGLWSAAAVLASVEFPVFIADAYPKVVDPYISMAATLAATWFELSDPASTYVAALAPLPPAEKLQKSAEWALSQTGDAGRSGLTGSMQRAVFDGARETTRVNVQATNSKWAVDARPQACPWCRMMATRGAVYRSEAGALASCHDHGHCVAMEVRPGQHYSTPDHVQQWDDQYLKARADAGSGDPKAVQAAWRQLLTQ